MVTKRSRWCLTCAMGLALVAASASGGVFYDLATDPGGLGANLVAYWRLGESNPSSPAADVTGNYPGTYTNFTTSDLGRPGALVGDTDTAANFDLGDPQYVNFGDVIVDNRTQLSAGVWVKVDTLNKDHTLLAKGKFAGNEPILFWRDDVGWSSSRTDTYSIKVSTGTGSGPEQTIEGPTGISTDTNWHFAAFTYKGGDTSGLKLYLDGKLQMTLSTASVPWLYNNSSALTAGYPIVGMAGKEMDGLMDDIVIFDRVLTRAEMRRLYLGGQGIVESLESITTDFSGGLRNLTSATLLRGALGRETIPAADLIPVDIVHLNTSDQAALLNAVGGGVPAAGSRATWLNDAALGTGICNVGAGTGLSRDPVSTDRGLGITFRQAVINGPGPDVIIFELDNNDPDPFVVGPWSYNGRVDLHPFSVSATDYVPLGEDTFTAYVYQAASAVTSLALLESLGFSLQGTYTGFDYYGYALDLTDLGYLPGQAVSGLFLQSLDASNLFDPLLIVGLPSAFIPEPGTMLLLAGGLLALARRRASARARRR
ncbi:MAG TPA: LamG-like jellyroll fold domain-containing protein [Planctomycetota bacterium]|nr:LamG-like jellyroll fold domain-containing protein [Planctomycetota bacterium]